jgi:hypothetical protein
VGSIWWLSDGHGTSFGPFTASEIDTRWQRYRLYRRHSSASRRECWRKAKDEFFKHKRRAG